jgi:hypothetical protein
MIKMKKKERKKRTRTFKTPVIFNPTAGLSVRENWTFLVAILRILNAE